MISQLSLSFNKNANTLISVAFTVFSLWINFTLGLVSQATHRAPYSVAVRAAHGLTEEPQTLNKQKTFNSYYDSHLILKYMN